MIRAVRLRRRRSSVRTVSLEFAIRRALYRESIQQCRDYAASVFTVESVETGYPGYEIVGSCEVADFEVRQLIGWERPAVSSDSARIRGAEVKCLECLSAA